MFHLVKSIEFVILFPLVAAFINLSSANCGEAPSHKANPYQHSWSDQDSGVFELYRGDQTETAWNIRLEASGGLQTHPAVTCGLGVLITGGFSGHLSIAHHTLVARGERDAFLAVFNPDTGNLLQIIHLLSDQQVIVSGVVTDEDSQVVVLRVGDRSHLIVLVHGGPEAPPQDRQRAVWLDGKAPSGVWELVIHPSDEMEDMPSGWTMTHPTDEMEDIPPDQDVINPDDEMEDIPPQ